MGLKSVLANKIAALEGFIQQQTQAAKVTSRSDLIGRLGGGAIQENWALDLDLDGERSAETVLRADAPEHRRKLGQGAGVRLAEGRACSRREGSPQPLLAGRRRAP